MRRMRCSRVLGFRSQRNNREGHGENIVETFEAAQYAIGDIEHTLESILYRALPVTSGTNYLPFSFRSGTTDADLTNLGASNLLAALNTSSDVSSNDQLYFVFPGANSFQKSYFDLVEHGYFVCFAKGNYNSMRGNRYYLMRFQRNSDPVDTSFDIFKFPATFMNTPGNPASFGSFAKVPFVDNVISFNCQYIDTNTAVATNIAWKSRWPATTYLPQAVQVTMTILDRRMADRLAALCPDGLTAAERDAIVSDATGLYPGIANPAVGQLLREGARRYYRLINLQNGNTKY